MATWSGVAAVVAAAVGGLSLPPITPMVRAGIGRSTRADRGYALESSFASAAFVLSPALVGVFARIDRSLPLSVIAGLLAV